MQSSFAVLRLHANGSSLLTFMHAWSHQIGETFVERFLHVDTWEPSLTPISAVIISVSVSYRATAVVQLFHGNMVGGG